MKGVRNQPFSLLILIAHLLFFLASLFYTERNREGRKGEGDWRREKEQLTSSRNFTRFFFPSLSSLSVSLVLHVSDSLFQRLITRKKERLHFLSFFVEITLPSCRMSVYLFIHFTTNSKREGILSRDRDQEPKIFTLTSYSVGSWKRKEGNMLPSFDWLKGRLSLLMIFTPLGPISCWASDITFREAIERREQETIFDQDTLDKEWEGKKKRNREKQDIAGVISDAWKYLRCNDFSRFPTSSANVPKARSFKLLHHHFSYFLFRVCNWDGKSVVGRKEEKRF